MNEYKSWHHQTIGERVVEKLRKNGFQAVYCNNKEEALPVILEKIPAGSRVGIGGSATVRGVGVLDQLRAQQFVLYDHNAPGLTLEEKTKTRYQQQTADVFLTSSNAITLKGELVNRDGLGNRVSAMIFGPKRVVVVAGINKVVKDYEEADSRIKLWSAPLNVKRHEYKNPCIKTGVCMDCQEKTRICNITTILHKCPGLTEIHVVLIGEQLGF